MTLLRPVRFLSLLAVLAVCAVAPARAAACDTARFDAAIVKQKAAMAETERQSRRARCGGGLFSGRGNPACTTLTTAAASMQANLAALEQRRDRIAASCAGKAERAAAPRAATARGETRTAGVAAGFAGGNYRTLCVRACDGYYFPISDRAGRGSFARDEAMCRSACPRGDVSLFVHRNPGEASDDAVSLDGRRYRDLPMAFAYRKAFVPSCGCGAATTATGGPFIPASPMPATGPATGLAAGMAALEAPAAAGLRPIGPAAAAADAASEPPIPADDLFETRRLDLDIGPVVAEAMPAGDTPTVGDGAAPVGREDTPADDALSRPVRTVGPVYLPAQ